MIIPIKITNRRYLINITPPNVKLPCSHNGNFAPIGFGPQNTLIHSLSTSIPPSVTRSWRT